MTMLKFIKNVEKRGAHQYALYECICGVQKIIRVTAVASGNTKSCGCHRRKVGANNGRKARTTHGQTGTYLYWLWQDKVKSNSNWNTFEEFFEWAKPLWKKGLTIYSESGFYDKNSKFLTSKEVKNIHREKTCLEKYGCKSAFECDDTKNKIKKTNLKRYGVENPCVSQLVKDRTKENNRKKYGVDYPQQLAENRLRQKQFAVEKVGFDTENISKQLGISKSAFLNRVSKYGLDTAIALGNHCSLIESVIKSYLDNKDIKYSHNTKLDIYYPDFMLHDYHLVIETDGLYWHCDAVNTDYTYHRKKLDRYKELGYRSLFFREDEIHNKSDIVFSIIDNALKINTNKIFARKCKLIELNLDERKQFFETNHLMGKGRGNSYGLIFEDKLVSAIQFVNKDGVVDISRFCNILNTSVVGGFSKLISHIIRNNKVDKIQTFIDKRYGQGNYLLDLGFNQITDRLSFVWVKNNKTFHRLQYRGNSGYEYGMYKLWDCGQAKFEKIIN